MPNSQQGKPWSLSKVDIRSPISATASPVARIELQHRDRGRVSDVASGPGGLGAAFSAIGHIMGLDARIDKIEMQYVSPHRDGLAGEGEGPDVQVRISIEICGDIFEGHARRRDILTCCIDAFIDAACDAEAMRRIRPANPAPTESDGDRIPSVDPLPTFGRNTEQALDISGRSSSE